MLIAKPFSTLAGMSAANLAFIPVHSTFNAEFVLFY